MKIRRWGWSLWALCGRSLRPLHFRSSLYPCYSPRRPTLGAEGLTNPGTAGPSSLSLNLLSSNFKFFREALMDESHSAGAGMRRNEDIALDLMKFVAMTTGYGRTSSTGVGFQGTGAAAKPEDYAAQLLELYGKCLHAVTGKK